MATKKNPGGKSLKLYICKRCDKSCFLLFEDDPVATPKQCAFKSGESVWRRVYRMPKFQLEKE